MTELIKGGPYIPDDLMNLLEDQQVVFFCGAGISMGTGLPSFAGLVSHTYSALRTRADEVELEALDLPQDVDWDKIDLENVNDVPDFRYHPKYDKVFELLERPSRHGRPKPEDPSPVRRIVIDRLSQRSRGPLDIHRALLTLAETTRGIRLVTTNFDLRFEAAARSKGLKGALFDAAPKLPVPKFRDWHTCVHLHGAIDQEGRGDHLVLSAADFGRAYLTDRWAARFVTELFRDFHVVFIGYSLADPVMTYLVDALAAERSQGRPFKEAFAFADFDGSKKDAMKSERAWNAKNVSPILYDSRGKHRLLRDTLVEWARIKEDPFEARAKIALRDMSGLPDGPDGLATRNVVWALNDAVAARAIADLPPETDKEAFPKLASWLDVLADKGLLDRPTPINQSAAPIVGNEFRMHGPADLDVVGMALCRWIGKHLHAPEILERLLRLGGHLHPYLRGEIRRNLADEEREQEPSLSIDPRLRHMWTIIINQQTFDSRAELWLPQQFKLAVNQEKQVIVRTAIDMVSPRLEVVPGPSSNFEFRRLYDPDLPGPDVIQKCAHFRLAVGNQHDLDTGRNVLRQPDVLAPFTSTLTDYVARALELLRQSGEWDGDSSWVRPSISEHGQNDHRDKWTELIVWLRDSYFQLAKTDPRGAAALIGRWSSMKDKVFHRLALHSMTEDTKADIALSETILLKGRKKGLWDDELRRELLRFLRLAGKRIPRQLRTKLINAIMQGPKYGRRKNEDWVIRTWKREVGLRLGCLKLAGVKLNKKAQKLALPVKRQKEAPDSHRQEFNAWVGEVTWGSVEDRTESEAVRIPTRQLVAKINQDELSPEEFEIVLRRNLISGVFALLRMARNGEWPLDHWKKFVWRIGNTDPDKSHKLRQRAVEALYEAPDELIAGLGAETSRLLRDVARNIPMEDEERFLRIWTGAWNAIGPTEIREDWDRMTQALNDPAGNLAEAAISRMWPYKPEAKKGFPAPVRPYFERIGAKPEDILARVTLVRFLNNLYLIDPEWTKDHLIDPMTATDTPEAKDFWTAYGYSPRVSPNLLNAIKVPLFEILKRYDDEGKTDDNLVSMFTSVCLDLPNELSPEEIQGVLQDLPEGALRRIAHFLQQRMRITKEEKKAVWEKQIFPWLDNYWPRLAEKNTERTSEALAGLVLETGDMFPNAVDWSLNYLRPIRQHFYYGLTKSNFPTKYPSDTLKFLRQIVPDDGNIPWDKSYIQNALDAIKESAPHLGNSPDFIRLYRIATN